MTAFLIVLAVLALIVIIVLSLSATVTVVYDKGWHTKIKILFYEKEIVLSEILSMIVKTDKSESNPPKNTTAEETSKPEAPEEEKTQPVVQETSSSEPEQKDTEKPAAPAAKKPNPIQKIWNDEGIVGILSLVSNLLQTANSAILTLIRGLHIYSLYVMIIVGGGDAAQIGMKYGTVCQYYYPVKGLILNQMKVDEYDDYIQPDFIAPETEFEFQLIGSISVGLLVKVALKAGLVFLKNFINNKKGDKK